MRAGVLAALLFVACNDGSGGPVLHQPIDLPILEGFNHSSETSIASKDGVVVVLAVNQLLDGADSFTYPQSSLPRRVAAYVSTDGGETFEAPFAPNSTPEVVTDPVIVAGSNGTFFAGLLILTQGVTEIWSFAPQMGWQMLVGDAPIGDKEWLALTPDQSGLFIGGVRWYGQYTTAGELVSGVDSALECANALTAYATNDAGYFLTLDGEFLRYDGTALESYAPPIDSGDEGADDIWTKTGASMGLTGDGTEWLVFNRRSSTTGRRVMLQLREPGGQSISEHAISPEGEIAFLPAAALDDEGRLHVVWYDSSGVAGVVRYTRSESSDLTAGFAPSIVLDPQACPGEGWQPYSGGDDPPGGRRLREYIGIAVDGNRAHISWTHAPRPPSIVRTAYVDF